MLRRIKKRVRVKPMLRLSARGCPTEFTVDYHCVIRLEYLFEGFLLFLRILLRFLGLRLLRAACWLEFERD